MRHFGSKSAKTPASHGGKLAQYSISARLWVAEWNDCACFGAVWSTAADRLFLMRYPNKKSQYPP